MNYKISKECWAILIILLLFCLPVPMALLAMQIFGEPEPLYLNDYSEPIAITEAWGEDDRFEVQIKEIAAKPIDEEGIRYTVSLLVTNNDIKTRLRTDGMEFWITTVDLDAEYKDQYKHQSETYVIPKKATEEILYEFLASKDATEAQLFLQAHVNQIWHAKQYAKFYQLDLTEVIRNSVE